MRRGVVIPFFFQLSAVFCIRSGTRKSPMSLHFMAISQHPSPDLFFSSASCMHASGRRPNLLPFCLLCWIFLEHLVRALARAHISHVPSLILSLSFVRRIIEAHKLLRYRSLQIPDAHRRQHLHLIPPLYIAIFSPRSLHGGLDCAAPLFSCLSLVTRFLRFSIVACPLFISTLAAAFSVMASADGKNFVANQRAALLAAPCPLWTR